ncbi:hypothetical protein N665_1328s0010 [Sinapis alba]|nr:hypothetical protein N665_1328s0010 [Sinapis alba]
MLCFKLDIKKKYELWCLVGPQPARFSLIEFEHLTGLNCDYVENLENLRCEVTEETIAFRQLLGVRIDVGPTTEQIIAACKRCSEWSRDDRMRLGYLAIFNGFIEGRKFSTVTRASLARLVMDLEEFENYPWGRVAFKVWVYYALPEFGAEYGHPVQNKPSPPLLAYNGGKRRRFFKDAIRKHSVLLNFVKKNDINEMWPKWDHDVEDKAPDHIVEVMWNENHHWTMECWKVVGATLGSNQKSVVVYAKNEEGYVKEETTVKEERPRKKARKETTVKAEESPREAEETPREAGEAPVGWITQEVFENGMKQMVDAMRDGFGMILREIKHVADRVEVVAERVETLEQLAKSTKGTASNEPPHTPSELSKRTDEFGVSRGTKKAEEANAFKEAEEAKANAAKEADAAKEAEEAKAKAAKEADAAKAAKEADAAKAAKEAKALKEAKAAKALRDAKAAKKARDAKSSEDSKAAKEAKEARDVEEAKEVKEAEDVEEGKASEGSIVIMDKQKPTTSDLETGEARRLAKSEAGLANVMARSERERKLASSQQSSFQGNSTAKIIIPNKKIGRGYDPFALPVDKRRTVALTDMLKKDRWYRTTPKKKPPGCPSLWYWTLRTPLEWLTDSHMDAFINVLRKRYTNDPHMFRSERMCILDHAFAQWWMSKYPDWVSSESDANGLGRRLPEGAWDLYGGVVPSFCQTNKIWGIHVDDIYAPVNYKNSHWLAILISIPKRHIVVWDNIVGCIRKAQLDQVMAPFVNMVLYLLVECAATVEEHCKYSLEPFTYEVVNAPQCESGVCGLFALNYIECHALDFIFRFPESQEQQGY